MIEIDTPSLASTVFPPTTPIPQPIKDLLNRFYYILDKRSEDCGSRLATEIFTADGQFMFPRKTLVGSEDLASSTPILWAGVHGRRHDISKIYVCDDTASDILMTGTMIVDIGDDDVDPNDHILVEGMSFCGRAVLDDPKSPRPRLKLFQPWVDNTPVVQALADRNKVTMEEGSGVRVTGPGPGRSG